jgi:hypothetical protein
MINDNDGKDFKNRQGLRNLPKQHRSFQNLEWFSPPPPLLPPARRHVPKGLPEARLGGRFRVAELEFSALSHLHCASQTFAR